MVTVDENGVDVIEDDYFGLDAHDAREAEESANRRRAVKVAEQLLARAERMKEHARRLLASARGEEQGADDPWDRIELLLSWDQDVIPLKVGGEVKYLDLPMLTEVMCVKDEDLEDEELLRGYIGSFADITERRVAELAEWRRNWDEALRELP